MATDRMQREMDEREDGRCRCYLQKIRLCEQTMDRMLLIYSSFSKHSGAHEKQMHLRYCRDFSRPHLLNRVSAVVRDYRSSTILFMKKQLQQCDRSSSYHSPSEHGF